MKKTLLAVAMLTPIFSYAIPPGAVEIRTFGAVDCGEWTQANSNTNKAWLLGYLSGINFDFKAHENALGQLNSAAQAIGWMDNYCRANPLRQVIEGAHLLMDDLSTNKKKK